jgi:hypothetical protein
MWLLKQMLRWGHLPVDQDLATIASRSVDAGPY